MLKKERRGDRNPPSSSREHYHLPCSISKTTQQSNNLIPPVPSKNNNQRSLRKPSYNLSLILFHIQRPLTLHFQKPNRPDHPKFIYLLLSQPREIKRKSSSSVLLLLFSRPVTQPVNWFPEKLQLVDRQQLHYCIKYHNNPAVVKHSPSD
ncbi:hypothetical protein Peur_013404 [Populus x canadensis]